MKHQEIELRKRLMQQIETLKQKIKEYQEKENLHKQDLLQLKKQIKELEEREENYKQNLLQIGEQLHSYHKYLNILIEKGFNKDQI